MFGQLTDDNRKTFYDLAFLLITIYCAAILGDYIAEALVIKRLTVNALPRLFQINALLLFVVSLFLFGYIDRLHRWQVVRILCVVFFLIVAGCGLCIREFPWASQALYAASYLGKLSFFAVFWIIANDICDTRQSKALFPMVAGSGLVGGLVSTIISGKIVHLIHVENLVWIWAALIIVPFFIIGRLKADYYLKLKALEQRTKKNLKAELVEILRERAIVVMAGVYFLIFIIIFNLDFIFAKTLSERYTLPGGFFAEGFISFKFNAFLVITTLIILFQFGYVSNISKRFGVTNSLLVLPITLCIGFAGLHFFHSGRPQFAAHVLFSYVLVFYVLRQFLFESLFSSNYQIFFSAFNRKYRGRGKLLLEGIVKPLGIAAAGLFIGLGQGRTFYFSGLAVLAAILAILIFVLRREYSKILLNEEDHLLPSDEIMRMIKREISGKNKDKILSLISQALTSDDYDLKRVAIKYLEFSGNPIAFEQMRKRFFEESDRIKEIIANSLSTFDSVEARGFLRQLLENPNPAIRAGALRSIGRNQLLRPKNFNFRSLIFDHHPLVFEEAARFLHRELAVQERGIVFEKINAYRLSERIDERAVAVRLVGALKLEELFDHLVADLDHPSHDIWKAAVSSLLAFNHDKSVEALLKYIDGNVERHKESLIIESLGKVDLKFYIKFETYLLHAKKKRTAFSIIRILKLLAERHLVQKGRPIKQKPEVKDRLFDMAMREMEIIYTDIYRYYDLRITIPLLYKKIDLLKAAIGEKRKHFSMFVLDMLSILDNSGALLHIERNFKMLNEREKANIIELIEAFGEKNISRFLIPIMEEYSERELLKIGSSRWPYRKGSLAEAVRYFEVLENRWINSIALYIEHEALKHAA